MAKNEVQEDLASDLVSAGYAEALDAEKPKKAVKRNENQRGNG